MSGSGADARAAGAAHATFRLTARGADPDVELDVVDGWDRVVAGPTFSDLVASLPRGPYVVRFRLGGSRAERPLFLGADTVVDAPPMARASSAPIDGTFSSTADQTRAACELSQKTTGRDVGAQPTGRVFVFVRTPDRRRASVRPVGRGLRLVNRSGRVLASLDGGPACERSDVEGWSGVSLRVPPGPLLLRFAGPPVRLVPLQVFDGWQTQAFVLDPAGTSVGPRPDTLRVFLRRDGFDPSGQQTRDVDRGYEALANVGDGASPAQVPPSVVRWLLAEKFDDPMLGLLGAWLQLAVGRTVPPYVLDQIEALVGPSPDVVALRIASARRGGPLPRSGWAGPSDPPMFRAGLQALLDASVEHDEAIADGSPLDRLSPKFLADLVWTSWTEAVAAEAVLPAFDDLLEEVEEAGALAESAGTARTDEDGPRSVDVTGPRLRGRSPRSVTWVERALRDAGVTTTNAGRADVSDLARRLSLPPSAVRRALGTIRGANAD